MIELTGRFSYNTYQQSLLSVALKSWLRCDADNAFEGFYYTPWSSWFWGYDVVYNLTKDLQGKKCHAFYDNYFTGVKLADDLLVQKIYTCRTIKINRIGFPVELEGLKMRRGESNVL